MEIKEDRTYCDSMGMEFISQGYAEEDVFSLRLNYVCDRSIPRREPAQNMPDGKERYRFLNQRNQEMAAVMAAIAHEFVCYQYSDTAEIPYMTSKWDWFFWCNHFPSYYAADGLVGRDYSYFTLTVNERQAKQQHRENTERLVRFLKSNFSGNPHLQVTIQYQVNYDDDKIAQACGQIKKLLAGARIQYAGRAGKLAMKNNQLIFCPKYAKKRFFRPDEKELLYLYWSLQESKESLNKEKSALEREKVCG